MSGIDDLQAIDDDDDTSLQLTKEMELNSTENGFQELNDILKENEPNELVPSCISNKEQNPEEYAFGNLPTNNNDFSYYEFCSSPQEHIFSPLQAGFSDNVVFSDAQFAIDDERLLSFQVELNSTDAAVTNAQEMGHESSKSEDDILDVLKTTDSANHHELESIKKDTDAEVLEKITELSSKDHVKEEQEMEDSAKTNVSRDNDKKNHDSARHVSETPRKHRSRKRWVSKSPSRRKDTSSWHRRDHGERSRSRSPRRRQYHRRSRSPRRRYSPSYRSPPSSYRSRYRSPKRRNWSPPHNRITGLGKPGKNLFIAGFCFLTTERDLERKFSRFGRVRDVRIVRNKWSGESRGFGFLSLERDEDADEAIRVLDKTEWNGRIILVEKSKPDS